MSFSERISDEVEYEGFRESYKCSKGYKRELNLPYSEVSTFLPSMGLSSGGRDPTARDSKGNGTCGQEREDFTLAVPS